MRLMYILLWLTLWAFLGSHFFIENSENCLNKSSVNMGNNHRNIKKHGLYLFNINKYQITQFRKSIINKIHFNEKLDNLF